jgi:hypothetical protein
MKCSVPPLTIPDTDLHSNVPERHALMIATLADEDSHSPRASF